jgi:hypothetical protein
MIHVYNTVRSYTKLTKWKAHDFGCLSKDTLINLFKCLLK